MRPPAFSSRHPEIPLGFYCYGARQCPHFTTREVAGGVRIPWCGFLKAGSYPHGLPEEDAVKLKAHYGTEKFTDFDGVEHEVVKDHRDLCLNLLWDSCKECGTNEGDHAEYGLKHGPWRFVTVLAVSPKAEATLTLRFRRGASATEAVGDLLRQLRAAPAALARNAVFEVSAIRFKDRAAVLSLKTSALPGEWVRFAARLYRECRRLGSRSWALELEPKRNP